MGSFSSAPVFGTPSSAGPPGGFASPFGTGVQPPRFGVPQGMGASSSFGGMSGSGAGIGAGMGAGIGAGMGAGVSRGMGGSVAWLPTQQMGMVPMRSVDLHAATARLALTSNETNRVLGGGLVKGSAVLLAGEPGVGKSTLMMQLAEDVASRWGPVVYVSGEENAQQIAARAARLGLATDDIYLICDVDADRAVATISDLLYAQGGQSNSGGEDTPSTSTPSTPSTSTPSTSSTSTSTPTHPSPALVIVDSVQTMQSYAGPSSGGMGSVGQVRDCAALFVQLAKASGCVVLLSGHVTKAGEVAGPRTLEHMVDTVLYMEGNEQSEHRLLRSAKNRYGSTSEVG